MIRTFGNNQDDFGKGPMEIQTPRPEPEQKYVGIWEPGINHPTLPTLTSGPYAGIIRYLPLPESQIER